MDPKGLEDAIAEVLAQASKICVTTHITPDGDGLGSALALMRFLRGRGHEARLINCSATPNNLRFLVRTGEFSVYHPERHRDFVTGCDVICALDLGGISRLGRMEEAVRQSRATRVLIDHHREGEEGFDLCLVRPRAAASAEITYDLIRHMGGRISPELAEPLYVGLVSDTGGFVYQATSPRSHRIAATLMEAGADPHRIYEELHCRDPLEKLRALGECLADLQTDEDGRLVWASVDQAFLRRLRVHARDVFAVVDHFLQLRGVEVGAFFFEVDEVRTKVSLRSSGRVDVREIASGHGGGGHRYAAGCMLDESLPRAREAILRQLEGAVDALDSMEDEW